jgi:hypothetical protein
MGSKELYNFTARGRAPALPGIIPQEMALLLELKQTPGNVEADPPAKITINRRSPLL